MRCVACDRGARLARLRTAYDRAERRQAAADEIRADVCTTPSTTAAPSRSLALINAVVQAIRADDAPARMELPVAAAVTEEAR